MLRGSLPLAVVMSLLLLTSPAAARSRGPVYAAVNVGADRIVALQNADGGWFFGPDDPDCELGPGVSCPNVFGQTAQGVIAAYELIGDPRHLASAVRAADALVAIHDAGPPCDGDPATSADRPFAADVAFLVDVGRHVAGSHYRAVAHDWFACAMSDFSPTANADRRIDTRIASGFPGLGGWDAASDIRAAVAIGEHAYALGEVLQVIARTADWNVDDPACASCADKSKGLLLLATHALRDDPRVAIARDGWKHELLVSQRPDGSWRDDDEDSPQTTAYALMGLTAVDRSRATRVAIAAAVSFLTGRQRPNGGFTDGAGDESVFQDGEVVKALSAVRGD